jgi:hypothetical protein
VNLKAHTILLRLIVLGCFLILPVTAKLSDGSWYHGNWLRQQNLPGAKFFCLTAIALLLFLPPAALGTVVVILWIAVRRWLSEVDRAAVFRRVFRSRASDEI